LTRDFDPAASGLIDCQSNELEQALPRRGRIIRDSDASELHVGSPQDGRLLTLSQLTVGTSKEERELVEVGGGSLDGRRSTLVSMCRRPAVVECLRITASSDECCVSRGGLTSVFSSSWFSNFDLNRPKQLTDREEDRLETPGYPLPMCDRPRIANIGLRRGTAVPFLSISSTADKPSTSELER